ncbi:ribosomal protein S18-alanine N-acetyltransferase [Oscillospiraceae bacterium MB08-C2-2]|nr:ribosomal protein S18-alanine N-acetyltransferase [Oscillospiraceae bacterium MB08-C2-2]
MDTPEPRIRISAMSVENVEKVEELEKACFSAPWSLDSLVEELSNPMAVFRVAYLGEELAGYMGMHHIIDEGYITNIGVFPQLRRQGVARALLEDMLCYGEENDLNFLTLEVRPSNEAAIALYKAYGFEEAGRRTGYYQNPVEDALLLTRKL